MAALPFSERSRKEELSTKYGVQGIPTLVLLDGKGGLVSDNIRGDHAKYLGGNDSPGGSCSATHHHERYFR